MGKNIREEVFMIIPKAIQTSQMVADHYNDLDPFYRELWGEHVHHGYWKTGKETQAEAVKELVELVAHTAEIQPDQKVCDVGCGYGGTARLLNEKWGAKVTGLTLSKAQYDYACQLATGPQFYLRDWLDNQLERNSFHTVLSIESSEHMIDKKKFFSECHRVLNPQGKLVICVWIAKDKAAKWEEKWLLEPICREGRLPSMGTCEDYQSWMQEAGFCDIQVKDLSKQVRKTWALCGLRVLDGLLKKKSFRKTLMDRSFKDRIFALTVFRIWCAYYTGSMRYLLFSASKID